MDKQKLSELGGHPGVSQLAMGTAGTQIQVFLALSPVSFSLQLDAASLVGLSSLWLRRTRAPDKSHC